MRLVLRTDLKGIAHLLDKQTGREFAVAADRPLGLYVLYFGKSIARGKRVTVTSAVDKEVTRTGDGIRLTYEHKGTHPEWFDRLMVIELTT